MRQSNVRFINEKGVPGLMIRTDSSDCAFFPLSEIFNNIGKDRDDVLVDAFDEQVLYDLRTQKPEIEQSENKIDGLENAFPLYIEGQGIEFGMTLRDYFAAKAMQAYLMNNSDMDDEKLAKYSYMSSDAMIQARKNSVKNP